MFTRNLTLICAVSALALPAFGQDVPRTSAELPERLETGERAPMEVPKSSAEEVGDIAPAENAYGIGQPATEEEIAAIDIDVMPDGRGLPEGSGTYAEGEELYETICAACHGSDMMGIAELGAPRLIGGRDTLATDAPVKTVESYWPYASTFFDYTHRAMPMTEPGSLSADEVYAISAYVLGKAGITSTEPDSVMDAEAMAEVEMPNADGFVSDPRPDVSQ
ncbi:cytochrome c [Roseovarius nanhaiticus]|uniref:Cytochrome c n=1 Tax=Roseovarius nanhaiticus TaxID=573024 RepID=A0A1N7FRY7_9RHOB|nr:cytochrome c [Roseovarius nanhaiticus]SEK47212.1 cytochrome c [Roseovarius nanhaiticus]SIS03026.1 cytochrome c [Roseovarius nanhaiticus]